MTASGDSARHAYWAEQMQIGYDLIQQVLPFEVRECGEGFASIPDSALQPKRADKYGWNGRLRLSSLVAVDSWSDATDGASW